MPSAQTGGEVTMERQTRVGRCFKIMVAVAMAALLGGCAAKAPLEPLFWPTSPDLPRVQYLRAIKDSTDVVELSTFSLLTLGEDTTKAIAIGKPFGIAVRKGTIYLTDTVASDLLIIDLIGKKMSRLPGNVNHGKLKKPAGVAVDDEGNIYVADTARNQVLQYNAKGEFVQPVGADINMRPTDVKIEEEYLYVTDSANNRILVLNRRSGELLREIGKEAPDNFKLSFPMGLATDDKGMLYTTNFDGKIVAFDRDGHFLKGFGRLGQSFGDFGRPRGVAVDKEGLIYVVDAAMQHVQVFDEHFRLLMYFGGPGTRGSLNVPAGIAISTENLDFFQKLAEPDFIIDKVLYVVSQFGDHKISIYGMGKRKGVDYEAEYKRIEEEVAKKNKELIEEKRKKKEEEEKGAQPAAAPEGGK